MPSIPLVYAYSNGNLAYFCFKEGCASRRSIMLCCNGCGRRSLSLQRWAADTDPCKAAERNTHLRHHHAPLRGPRPSGVVLDLPRGPDPPRSLGRLPALAQGAQQVPGVPLERVEGTQALDVDGEEEVAQRHRLGLARRAVHPAHLACKEDRKRESRRERRERGL